MSVSLTLYQYRIPFRAPFRNAKGVFHHREGLILGNGRDVWCEIAPLPGFSSDSLEEALRFLKAEIHRIHEHFVSQTLDDYLEDKNNRERLQHLPSVRFGLSMLSEQQKAIAANLPLFRWWIEHSGLHTAGNTPPESGDVFSRPQIASATIRNNAVFGLVSPGTLTDQLKKASDSGFTTAKVKLPDSVFGASALISRITSAFPDLTFRFDANGAFSASDAHVLFERISLSPHSAGTTGGSGNSGSTRDAGTLSKTGDSSDAGNFNKTGNTGDSRGFSKNDIPPLYNLEYIEEPVNAPDVDTLAGLRKWNIPIAADESVRSADQARHLITNGAIDALVIKPAMVGSFREISEMITGTEVGAELNSHNIPVTISSTFETGIGRTLAAHIAAFSNARQQTVHGLATENVLLCDIRIRNGISIHPSAMEPSPEITLDAEPGPGAGWLGFENRFEDENTVSPDSPVAGISRDQDVTCSDAGDTMITIISKAEG